jgi:AcrR family transcriptional regulator
VPETAVAPSPRRAAILDAALAAFIEHGVAGASIEDIRARSGASIGSIYHHFGGKDAIAGTLYLDAMRVYQQGFLESLASSDDARDGVEGAVRHTLAWLAEHRDLARFLLLSRDARVVVATKRPLRDLNHRFFAGVARWMRPHVQRGELRDLDPELLTALWVGPSLELARLWLAGRTRSSLTDAAPVLSGAAWSSLKRQED